MSSPIYKKFKQLVSPPTISVKDFEHIFGEPISDRLAKRIEELCLEYIELTPYQENETSISAIQILLDQSVQKSGEESEGKIKIDKLQRSFIGGNLFTEVSIAAWHPK